MPYACVVDDLYIMLRGLCPYACVADGLHIMSVWPYYLFLVHVLCLASGILLRLCVSALRSRVYSTHLWPETCFTFSLFKDETIWSLAVTAQPHDPHTNLVITNML